MTRQEAVLFQLALKVLGGSVTAPQQNNWVGLLQFIWNFGATLPPAPLELPSSISPAPLQAAVGWLWRCAKQP